MKTKITLSFFALFLAVNLTTAQQECAEKTSIFHEYVKAKNYEAAYTPWKEVYETCPKMSLAIYIDGENLLKHRIENSNGAEKAENVKALAKLYDDRLTHFPLPKDTKKGDILTDRAQLIFDNNDVFSKSNNDLYKGFDRVFIEDRRNFVSPRSILSYFKLMVGLYDAGEQPAEALFTKYDEISEHLEMLIASSSEELNKLVAKEDAGQPLSSREGQYKKYHSQVLAVFDQISGSIDAELGQRANCENLVPLYRKSFDENRTNEEWLRRAAGRMSGKECTDDPLFIELVNALHNVKPSSNSAYYLGILQDKKGDSNKALKFYEQALGLETDSFKKAKLSEQIGDKLKQKGSYGSARTYFNQSLSLNPSNGRPHLKIANMYASSANNCGDTNFNKRAVFWLAAAEARKAARVDPTLNRVAAQTADNFMAKAPQKSDIFNAGNAGQTIRIGCWIGSSVTVPNL